MEYLKTLKKSLIFSLQPKRWIWFFMVDALFLFILLAFISPKDITSLLFNITGYSNSFEPSLSWLFTWIIIGTCIWGMIRLWIIGALVYQSYKEKEFKKSWMVSKDRFLSLLIATVIITIFSLIPLPFLALVITWIFFFVYQEIIIRQKGVFLSMDTSLKIFKKKFFTVILTWVLGVAGVVLMASIFLIPAVLLLFIFSTSISLSIIDSSFTILLITLLYLLRETPVLVGIIILIAAVGIEIGQVFYIKLQTDIYLQLKKKRVF